MAANYCTRVVRPVAAPQLKQLVEQSRANPAATVFIKFASAFCGACKASKPAIDQAMRASQKCLDVVEIDSDVADSVADGFGVKALPTMVAMRGGKVVGRMEGSAEASGYTRFFAKHSGE
jgi:thioredoxin-like negative regulator of GroEL